MQRVKTVSTLLLSGIDGQRSAGPARGPGYGIAATALKIGTIATRRVRTKDKHYKNHRDDEREYRFEARDRRYWDRPVLQAQRITVTKPGDSADNLGLPGLGQPVLAPAATDAAA